jgi:predicted RecA/RadA family phage recombinase
MNNLRSGAVGAPRRYLTEIPMPVMVDSEGKYVSFTPTAPVAAGAIVALGELVGIAPVAIAVGAVGQIAVRGIVRVPKPPNTGIAAGTRLWWDILAGTVVLVPFSDEFGLVITPYLGKAVEGSAKAATTVRARLSQ